MVIWLQVRLHPRQCEVHAREDNLLRGLRLPLFSVATATMFFLATPAATLSQQAQSATDEQEEVLVKAGESYTFTVNLKEAPTSSDGKITYQMYGLFSTISAGPPRYPCGSTVPGQKTYVCEIKTDKTMRGEANVTISDMRVEYPDKTLILPKKTLTFHFLGAPPPVEITEGADVTVNLSQAQLLRLEGTKLRRRIATLQTAVAELEKANASVGPMAELLRSNVKDAIDALQATESDFEKRSTEQKQISVSRVFFEDLRITYERALETVDKQIQGLKVGKTDFPENSTVPTLTQEFTAETFLANSSAYYQQFGSTFQKEGSHLEAPGSLSLVREAMSGNSFDKPTNHNASAEDVVFALQENTLAYETVADAESLTFDLDISSEPAGAEISYRRRGDSYKQNPDETNAVIRTLPYAIWQVRIRKGKYQSVETEHDPYRNKNHAIHVQLRLLPP